MANKNIGGQAVVEGVMLRNGATGEVAVANRLESGKIHIEKKKMGVSNKNKFLKLPLVRGVAAFIDSLIVGTKTLMDSASVVGGETAEDYKPSKFEKFVAEKLHVKLEDVIIFFSLILGLGLAVVLFTLLPTFITGFFKNFISSNILLSLIEGCVKVIIFLCYLKLVSLQKDIKRVFCYHGAEHKTINCYESGDEVTVENVRKHSRIHPRCGTSFLFFVMIVSILLFSLISWNNVFIRVLLKLLLMPVVAGISYEIIRFSSKTDSKIVHILVTPGLALQKITTSEPDDEQIMIGIASLRPLIEGNFEVGKEILDHDGNKIEEPVEEKVEEAESITADKSTSGATSDENTNTDKE